MARKLAAVAQLLGRRIEEEMAVEADIGSIITGFARTTAEVSAAMNMTAARARQLVAHAEALECRLPAVAALLAAGLVDWYTVEIILARTDFVDDDKCALVDAEVAEQLADWQCWSRQRIINAVDAAVTTIDAEAAKRRRVVAFDQRGIAVTAGLDGMARLRGSMSALAGAVFDKRLSELAKAVCAQDPRTLKQRRVDALEALLDGQPLPCGCENPDCPTRGQQPPSAPPEATADPEAPATPAPPATPPPPAPAAPEAPAAPTPSAKPVINVIATAATLAGTSEQPGYLVGFGVIDAAMVRELARDAARRILEQPEISDAQALRYRPSAALDRWIRFRDLTCRFPGCTVPAERCDVDHTVPFNHADPASGGLTVPWNLACNCREHHRLKTFQGGPDGWQVTQLPDGTLVWTSPSGQVYRTTPGGAELFAGLRQRRPRRPEDQKRVAAARARLRERRPIDEYHRHRNWAAAREIEDRLFRNRFRRTRVLFHGSIADKPSNSPFCRWVNDPLEPEHLPPDWQPPPLTPPDLDEPPPF